ncbi:GCN5 family acetyltransferase, partial [Curtobacterium luteum]
MTTPEHTPTTDDIDIEVEHFDSPDAQRLRAAPRVAIDRAYGQDNEPREKHTAESIEVFFVDRDASS